MTPQKIQDIKDRAAKEFGRDSWETTMRFASNIRKNAIIDLAIEIASNTEIKVPRQEDIESMANSYDNSMSSMAESIWMPQGFEKGANWAIERIKELNK